MDFQKEAAVRPENEQTANQSNEQRHYPKLKSESQVSSSIYRGGHDAIEEFRLAMQSAGITPPEIIIADGKLHRFPTNQKHGDTAGWYVFHMNGIPIGIFGDFRKGITLTWSAKSTHQMTTKERKEYFRQIKDSRRQYDQDKSQHQKHAAMLASKILNYARSADPSHPYLLNKQIPPFIARQIGNDLILPLIDFMGTISSLQFIRPDGSKKLLRGGAKKGRFIRVNAPDNCSLLLICEGFATGATLAQAYPDACVIAAIDAGNLKDVAILRRLKRNNAGYRNWPQTCIFQYLRRLQWVNLPKSIPGIGPSIAGLMGKPLQSIASKICVNSLSHWPNSWLRCSNVTLPVGL